MNKQLLMAGMTIVSLVVTFSGCIEEKSSGIVIEGKGSYTSIQNAIDNASDGDTIFVFNGTYYEKLVIDKSINLIGSGDGEKIVDYNRNESGKINIVLITADNCTISGFKIINSNDSSNSIGINIKSFNNIISTNTILNTTKGVYIENDSGNNTVSWNNISNNQYGLDIKYSDNHNISNNNISLNNQYGIYIYKSNSNVISDNTISDTSEYGIYMSASNSNVISDNTISDTSEYGIRIKGSKNNKIFRNLITDNKKGIYFCCGAQNNIMYYNTFKQNSEWSVRDSLGNQCNNGSVGNYWDDYTEKYPDAIELDGIWNISYDISGGNQDKYPLVYPVVI